MKEKKKKLNWRQACAKLGIGRTKFYELIASGALPAFRVGLRGMWVYDEDLDNLIQQVVEEVK